MLDLESSKQRRLPGRWTLYTSYYYAILPPLHVTRNIRSPVDDELQSPSSMAGKAMTLIHAPWSLHRWFTILISLAISTSVISLLTDPNLTPVFYLDSRFLSDSELLADA